MDKDTMKLIRVVAAACVFVSFTMCFPACGKSAPKKTSKYRFSANNGFCAGDQDLFWIQDGKVSMIDLGDVLSGDDYLYYDFSEIPQDVSENNIIGLCGYYGQDFIIREKNKLSRITVRYSVDEGGVKKDGYNNDSLFTFPHKDYVSICIIGNSSFSTDIATLRGKELTVWNQVDVEKFVQKKYHLQRKYETAFYLGGNRIGLVNGNEIDFMQVEMSEENTEDTKFIEEFASLPDHLTLDKQYDAYVGLYDNGWFFDGKTAYLGCIEGDTLRFYNIKKGRFATIPPVALN